MLPTIIALPLRIFGYTFTRYVFMNFCMFVTPASFLCLCIFRRLFGLTQKKRRLEWLLFLLIPLTFLITKAMPVFQRYIDVAILLSIFHFCNYHQLQSPQKHKKLTTQKTSFLEFCFALLFSLGDILRFGLLVLHIASAARHYYSTHFAPKIKRGALLASICNICTIGT